MRTVCHVVAEGGRTFVVIGLELGSVDARPDFGTPAAYGTSSEYTTYGITIGDRGVLVVGNSSQSVIVDSAVGASAVSVNVQQMAGEPLTAAEGQAVVDLAAYAVSRLPG